MSDYLDEYTPELFVERIIKNTNIDTTDKRKLDVLCELYKNNTSDDLHVTMYCILEWIKGLYKVKFDNEEEYDDPDSNKSMNLPKNNIVKLTRNDIDILNQAIVISANSYNPKLCYKLSDLMHRLEKIME